MSAKEDQAHESLIKTPKQLVVAVLLAFIVPIIVITLLAQLASSGRIYDKDSPAMSYDEVVRRIRPVAEVSTDSAPGNAATPAAAGDGSSGSAVAAPAAKTSSGMPNGRKVYESTCMACHAAGVANAPKFGDKNAWAPHLTHGVKALYNTALKGKGPMPPKGGNLTLSDADVRAAVDYMVAAVK